MSKDVLSELISNSEVVDLDSDAIPFSHNLANIDTMKALGVTEDNT
jgi:hypothetical protein